MLLCANTILLHKCSAAAFYFYAHSFAVYACELMTNDAFHFCSNSLPVRYLIVLVMALSHSDAVMRRLVYFKILYKQREDKMIQLGSSQLFWGKGVKAWWLQQFNNSFWEMWGVTLEMKENGRKNKRGQDLLCWHQSVIICLRLDSMS